MDDFREYEIWARTIQERINRELGDLKGENDRKRLSDLYILASSAYVGLRQIVSKDEDIESIESVTPEELDAERATWESLKKLAAAVDAVTADLRLVDDSEEADGTLSPVMKKVSERWGMAS
jgi:hypothetical protein